MHAVCADGAGIRSTYVACAGAYGVGVDAMTGVAR